jgi:hypothetical protein
MTASAESSDSTNLTVVELAAININNRFSRIADALEKIASLAERFTVATERTADAFEAVAATLNCVTETVEDENGETRCMTLPSARVS